MIPPSRRVYEWLLATVLAATVFTFVCGSSAVIPVLNATRPVRWAMLIGLCACAIVYAAVWGSRLPLLRPSGLVASGLLVLAILSTAWSVDPRLTFARAGSVAILFTASAALASGSAGRDESVRTLLAGLLGGAVAAAVAGLIVLAVSHPEAVQPASTEYGSRYRGLGENPNTVAALLAVVVPASVAFVLGARSRRGRLAALAVLALLDGSTVASGSRGAMLAAFAGTLVLVPALGPSWRARGLLVAAVLVVLAADLVLTQVSAPATTASRERSSVPTRDAQKLLPLEAEIGRGPLDRPPPVIHRTLLGSSGRTQAWRGALGQVGDRPLEGYGFGMEAKVFVDRYYFFNSASPENSYIGMLLQLGTIGLAGLAGLAASLLVAARRAFGVASTTGRLLVAAGAGGFVAGLVLAVAQSFLLSVGNVATLSVWVCATIACAQSAGAPLFDLRARAARASVTKTR